MIHRVSLIVIAKRLGGVARSGRRSLHTSPLDDTPTQADWKRIARLWREETTARRKQLENLQRELTGCIGCGRLSP
ncbi:MerR family DNA-binding protein [Microbacterium resistens]|uniref:MerR family DNA-binding protein n=1 Tax=Microbacterium resistens TaxID=156977 RepID=UPI000A8D140B